MHRVLKPTGSIFLYCDWHADAYIRVDILDRIFGEKNFLNTIISWDFTFNKDKGFKPSVIIDKEGKQTLTLKAGSHSIAVKVVDNDGLENMEVVQLKINGEIEKL